MSNEASSVRETANEAMRLDQDLPKSSVRRCLLSIGTKELSCLSSTDVSKCLVNFRRLLPFPSISLPPLIITFTEYQPQCWAVDK